jgi:alpha-methylacyl-CoA racemase
MWGLRAMGFWDDALGVNVLDTGAPFYDTYETADGKFVSIGSLEPQFFAELVERLSLEHDDMPVQMDRAAWPKLREWLTELFKRKTRDEWSALLEGTDACFAPVLPMGEAAEHRHVRARDTIVERDGVLQPAPAPRFSRTPGAIQRPPAWPGQHTDAALTDWGFTADELAKLRDAGAIR